ncbi:carbon-nitrogen hydrolase family protein [Nigerium massiliense]|uniref:carbon-nitrogen hydrolase family protein n=1 Tax=Nigerium massiliense TaxID=1522317 RepID=UPI000A87F2A6|nr:carbon-nitrogen hydrolase family protein [Nigerium massiliense]
MLTPHLRVAAVQISASDDVEQNLAAIGDAAARAADAGAQVIVFPEASMVRFGVPLARHAQPLDGPFADGVRAIAAEHGAVLVVGMFTPAEDGRVYNTLLATGAGMEATYDKIHLYDAFGSRESDTVAPGDQHVTFTAFGTTFGLATCYDLRFADQFTALGRLGAKVICVPASWGDGPGKAEQWDLLVRARAMDAQAWLVAAGQAWTTPQGSDPLGIGRSACVDPLGGVRARLSSAEDLLVSAIDLDVVGDVRARVPVLRPALSGEGVR